MKTNQQTSRVIGQSQHTDAIRRVARAPRALPEVAGGTMHILVMLVPDVAEKVDAVRALQ